MLYALYGKNPKAQPARAYSISHAYAKCYVHMPQTFIKEVDLVAANATYVAKNALRKKKIPLTKNFPTTHTPLP